MERGREGGPLKTGDPVYWRMRLTVQLQTEYNGDTCCDNEIWDAGHSNDQEETSSCSMYVYCAKQVFLGHIDQKQDYESRNEHQDV